MYLKAASKMLVKFTRGINQTEMKGFRSFSLRYSCPFFYTSQLKKRGKNVGKAWTKGKKETKKVILENAMILCHANLFRQMMNEKFANGTF
jgi:hypothetical protein